MIDFDVVLREIGGFGRYQLILVVMVCYYSIPSGINGLIPVFMNYRPEFRCNVPPIDNSSWYPNLVEDDIFNLTTPYNEETESYDGCMRYNFDLDDCIPNNFDCVNTSAEAISCDMGYHYNDSLFPRTVVTEFDLVCDRAILDPIATSIFFVGVLVGSTVFGILADRFGRKIIMVLSSVIGFGALIGCTFVYTYSLFVLCRFLVAFFGFGTYLISFVYLIEIIPTNYRTPVGVSFQIFYAIGYMILSGLAYNWRDWHELNFASAIIALPYTVFLFLIPESPRWLFSNDQNEKAKKISRRFARLNGKLLNEPNVWEEAERSAIAKQKEENAKIDTKKYSTADLFRRRRIRKVTIELMFLWFVNSFIYYGISLNAGTLSGDIFLNNLLNGVMEAGSYIFVIVFMDCIGRRSMQSVMLVISSAGLFIAAAVNEFSTNENAETLNSVSLVFSFVAKFGISGSFAVIYNFTAELYPTVIRSNGIGFCSTVSKLGAVFAPLVNYVQYFVTWLPNIMFGIFSLIAAILSFTLPETKTIEMMETIEEAEEFYSRNGRTMLFHNNKEISDESTINVASDAGLASEKYTKL